MVRATTITAEPIAPPLPRGPARAAALSCGSGTDWLNWDREYDDPTSSLSRRLQVVQGYLGRILAEFGSGGEPIRLLSICVVGGGDVLPVLARLAGPSHRCGRCW